MLVKQISRTTTTALKKHDDVLTDEAAKSTSAQTEGQDVFCQTAARSVDASV